MFRVKKSNHSKKIVKQLKKEYKEDLEKSGYVKQETRSGVKALCLFCTISDRYCLSDKYMVGKNILVYEKMEDDLFGKTG